MSRRPVLVVFAPAYPPQIGGVERHLERVHRELRSFEVHVFARPAAGFAAEEVVEGVTVRRVSLGAVGEARIYARFGSLLRRAVAVHSHDVFPFLLRRLLPRKRWVHTFHGYEGYPLGAAAVASRRRVRATVDHAVCVGAFIERWYGTPCDDVIYGATDAAATPAEPEWDAIFYGRLEEDTGIDAYLEGFARAGRDKKLLVVGDGSRALELHRRVEGLDVELRPATKDVLELAARARVAFVSGYLAILEAGRLRKPVVAYYGNPIKEDYLRCHPVAEHLWLASSPEEIARAFEAALVAPPERVEAVGRWADEQTWERISARYARAYAAC